MDQEENLESLHIRLAELRMEHRDLDEIISQLHANPYQNQLQLQRLKKRKLRLKDMIKRIESLLIPDMDA
ncbi:MAG TPA: DUF465 domain-containing protein [Gammaproteobacteria bacterium]|jgi:hypothetical protein|nr:DUF465 domain-containing protein [Gammaproteobacteria bacterium]